jgi:hypothetical protein
LEGDLPAILASEMGDGIVFAQLDEKVEGDGGFATPGEGVLEEDDVFGDAGGVDAFEQRVGTGDGQRVSGRADGAHLVADVEVVGFDAGATEDIVDLVDAEGFPCLGEFFPGIGGVAAVGGEGLDRLGGVEGAFGPAMVGLDGSVSRVAAAGVVLEFVSDDGDGAVVGRGFDGTEEVGHLGEAEFGKRVVFLKLKDAGELALGGAATVITDTEEEAAMVEAFGDAGLPLGTDVVFEVVWGSGFALAVVGGHAPGEHPAAVRGFPLEEVGTLDGEFVILGPHEAVVLEAGPAEHLGEAPGVSERVDVVSDGDVGTEGLEEEAFAVEGLAGEALGRREVAVGLLYPAVDDLPAALADEALDLLE